MSLSRKGKIARLPLKIRKVVNKLLANGWPGNLIVEWLNERPEVQEVMEVQFNDRPLTKQNLSEWKKGGYREWLKEQRECDVIRQLTERADDLQDAAGDHKISNRISVLLSAELARLAPMLLDKTKNPKARWQRLQEILHNTSELRRDDYHAGKLTLARQQWHVDLAKKSAAKKGAEKAMPVFNLLMEDAIHRMMVTGKHYDQRAKDILNQYFRPDDNGTASPPAQADNSGSVQASQTQSNPVQVNPSESDQAQCK